MGKKSRIIDARVHLHTSQRGLNLNKEFDEHFSH